MRILSLVFILLLGGCTTLGESDFKCGGVEAGIKCQPVSGVYGDVTESNYSSDRVVIKPPVVVLKRNGLGFGSGNHSKFVELDNANEVVPHEFNEKEELLILGNGDIDSLVLVNPPTSEGSPTIVSEQRERVLINAGIDDHGNYHESHYIYFKSKQSSWSATSYEKSNLFEPLK